jgi:hypothetical protein
MIFSPNYIYGRTDYRVELEAYRYDYRNWDGNSGYEFKR